MPEQHEPRFSETPGPTGGRSSTGVVDLLAAVLAFAFAVGLVLLLGRVGPLPAQLGFAGGAGVAASCVTAWRRLRRPEMRRWRCGQAVYRGRRITFVSAWGVEGQQPPAIEPSPAETTSSPPADREHQ
jgi:hypothetical protein